MTFELETDHRRVPLFEERTWPDIAAAVAADAPVIVPMGATEQHGGHLPLGADTMQGVDMCRRASAVLAREGVPLLVGPAIPFGPLPFLSESPKDFPGTIVVSNDTLRMLTRDVCVSLIAHGFRRIYLLLANVESEYAMHIVAKELTEGEGWRVIVENRPGGVTTIAATDVLSQPADGHSLYAMSVPSVAAPSLVPNISFNSTRTSNRSSRRQFPTTSLW